MSQTTVHRLAYLIPEGGSADDLDLMSFQARERLSECFEYVATCYPKEMLRELRQRLGKPFAVVLHDEEGPVRAFHGVLSSVSITPAAGGEPIARLTLRPQLWLLSKWSGCRIFQKMTTRDIVDQILNERGVSDVKWNNVSGLVEREFTVQYRESELNFIQRLCEEDGIFYHFEHEDDRHTLVFDQGAGKPATVKGFETLPYLPRGQGAQVAEHSIHSLNATADVVTQTFSLADYDEEKGDKPAHADFTAKRDEAKQSVEPEAYAYPGRHRAEKGAGETDAETLAMAERAHGLMMRAEGDVVGLRPGCGFELVSGDGSSVFPAEEEAYLVVGATHTVTVGSYRSGAGEDDVTFETTADILPQTIPFKPLRATPKPRIVGPQTAVVVGPSGEEIHVDELMRVKCQFLWDREGQNDENSSCWIRVAQIWAGSKYGAAFIPRIGWEVVVEFLEGDPDRPIITGCVYNGQMDPPYELPANKTQSGIKTRSSKKDSGFNEFRIEDLKGQEHIHLHAEKDHEEVVKNNQTIQVGNNQALTVKKNRDVKIEEGDETHEVAQGKRDTTIQMDDTYTVKLGSVTHTIETGNLETTLKVGAETRTLDVGSQKLQLKMGSQDTKIDMGNQSTTLGLGNVTTKCSLGKITMEAMQAIELKVGMNTLKIDMTGISLNGMMLKFEGTALAKLASPIVQVQGSGMTMVKGGIVMIN